MTTASVCTIGDEILIGQIVDTNSSHIARALNELGVRVTHMVSIGDDHQTITIKSFACLSSIFSSKRYGYGSLSLWKNGFFSARL